jgi:hypothetical protein
MPRLIPRLLLAHLAIMALATRAPAAEFCVACSGPEATYRCEVGTGSNADPRAWLMCITELAREGGHDSCSVDRNAPVPCPGIHKVLAAPEGPMPPSAPPVNIAVPEPVTAPPPAPAQPPSAETAAAPEDPAAGEPKPKRVPRTVEELAADTYEQSKDGVKKASQAVSNTVQKAGDAVTGTAQKAGEKISNAGTAIGDAAKKTWNCVTSLFQSCE